MAIRARQGQAPEPGHIDGDLRRLRHGDGARRAGALRPGRGGQRKGEPHKR